VSGQPSGRRSRRAWGWHRLTDPWARRVVAAAGVGPEDLVLDLGAGDGALTRPLLATGARVVAVELHPGRLAALHRLAATEPQLRVVRADVTDLRWPRRPFRVVANPPYAGVSALLDRLLAPGSRLVQADLVLQRQPARRLSGTTRHHRLDVVQRLPRGAFVPPPRVDSVVLRIQRR
jgi:23S rRNA (adenine-N6)-dimethyltransferase